MDVTGAAGWWFGLKGQSGVSRSSRAERFRMDESTPWTLATQGKAKAPWTRASVRINMIVIKTLTIGRVIVQGRPGGRSCYLYDTVPKPELFETAHRVVGLCISLQLMPQLWRHAFLTCLGPSYNTAWRIAIQRSD